MEKKREEQIRAIIEGLKRTDYIKPDELPNIDLYMDQVTTFMDKHLESSKRYSEDKLLTKTMINNYTKNNLLPSPAKKKYSKDHMYLLIYIYYMKNILSISDIKSILEPITDKFFGNDGEMNLEQIYEEIFRLGVEQSVTLTKEVVRKNEKTRQSFLEVSDDEDREFLQTFAFVCMLCFDVYMKKQLIEKLIDDNFQFNVKEDAKKDKKAKEKDSKEADKSKK
ncbi:DUF1836 domain-containing protein [Clostridium sp. Marseille-P299]|uniref:DUF1836 domain-containing protein n=1 Tax=Clostridium sp. Marseille-P299 TaxID=1805477 RepID=UPI000AE07AD5